MTKQITLNQEQKDILGQIEILRSNKENIKLEIANKQNDIINLDIQIRDLRQKIPTLNTSEPTKTKTIKKVKTDQERIIEIYKEIDEIRARLGGYRGKND